MPGVWVRSTVVRCVCVCAWLVWRKNIQYNNRDRQEVGDRRLAMIRGRRRAERNGRTSMFQSRKQTNAPCPPQQSHPVSPLCVSVFAVPAVRRDSGNTTWEESGWEKSVKSKCSGKKHFRMLTPYVWQAEASDCCVATTRNEKRTKKHHVWSESVGACNEQR